MAKSQFSVAAPPLKIIAKSLFKNANEFSVAPLSFQWRHLIFSGTNKFSMAIVYILRVDPNLFQTILGPNYSKPFPFQTIPTEIIPNLSHSKPFLQKSFQTIPTYKNKFFFNFFFLYDVAK